MKKLNIIYFIEDSAATAVLRDRNIILAGNKHRSEKKTFRFKILIENVINYLNNMIILHVYKSAESAL